MKSQFVVLCFLLLFMTTAWATLPVTDGLVMHLDASSNSGVGDGNPISTWNDLSTADNDATQPTAGIQPLYIASDPCFFGYPVVRFDGEQTSATGDWMSLPSTTCNVGSFTMFAAARYAELNPNETQQYLVAGYSGGNERIRLCIESTDTENIVFEYRAGSSGWKAVTAPADVDLHIFCET